MPRTLTLTRYVLSTRLISAHFCSAQLQAVSGARDVLLACNRTRSGGDSYVAADRLCRCEELIVLCPSAFVSPLEITVNSIFTAAGAGGPTNTTTTAHDILSSSIEFVAARDQSGWILKRGSSKKKFKKKFFVLQEGVISFFEKALPRPSGLKGQLVLVGARANVVDTNSDSNNVSIDNNDTTVSIFTISISNEQHKDFQLGFENEFDGRNWFDAITDEISSCSQSSNNSSNTNSTSNTKNRFKPKNIFGKSHLADVGGGGVESESESRSQSMGSPSSQSSSSPPPFSLHYPSPFSVEVNVRVTSFYKICSCDPQGDEEEDTWMVISTTFSQDIKLGGGSSMRVNRGEEIVEIGQNSNFC